MIISRTAGDTSSTAKNIASPVKVSTIQLAQPQRKISKPVSSQAIAVHRIASAATVSRMLTSTSQLIRGLSSAPNARASDPALWTASLDAMGSPFFRFCLCVTGGLA